MRNTEVRALTGLRGLAAVFIVVYHGADKNGTGLAYNVLRHGYNAVDVFFVLSGFVMALTYGVQFRSKPSLAAYREFIGKRIARVYPLYAIATVFTFIIFALHLSHNELSGSPCFQLVVNLLGIQAWGLADSIAGPAWSISTEWAAYLLFPVLAALSLGRSNIRAWALCAVSWLSLAIIAYAPGPMLGITDARNGLLDIFEFGSLAPLVRCLAEFSLGLLAFRWRHRIPASYATPLMLILGVILLIPGSDLGLVLVCALLVPALFADEGLAARCLGSRPIFAIGIWSYSIYILHARFNPVRVGFTWLCTKAHLPGPSTLALILSIGVLIACSALTYRFIEKPMRGALRRLFALGRGMPVRREPAAP